MVKKLLITVLFLGAQPCWADGSQEPQDHVELTDPVFDISDITQAEPVQPAFLPTTLQDSAPSHAISFPGAVVSGALLLQFIANPLENKILRMASIGQQDASFGRYAVFLAKIVGLGWATTKIYSYFHTASNKECWPSIAVCALDNQMKAYRTSCIVRSALYKKMKKLNAQVALKNGRVSWGDKMEASLQEAAAWKYEQSDEIYAYLENLEKEVSMLRAWEQGEQDLESSYYQAVLDHDKTLKNKIDIISASENIKELAAAHDAIVSLAHTYQDVGMHNFAYGSKHCYRLACYKKARDIMQGSSTRELAKLSYELGKEKLKKWWRGDQQENTSEEPVNA